MAAITPARVGFLLLYMSCINLSLKSIYATELSHPTPKTWWLHRDGPEVYSAGRLTSRMIKYASEAGFKSIISLFTFEDEPVLGDGQVLVTTADEKFVTEGLGLEFYVIHDLNETAQGTWKNSESVGRFANVFARAKRPVIVHCYVSWSSTAFVLMHWLNATKHGLEPEVEMKDAAEMFNHFAGLGYDPAFWPFVVDVTGEISGETIELADIPKADVSLSAAEWNFNYWQVLPVHGRMYAAGQMQTNQLDAIALANFTTVINLRQNDPQEEEVTLLNIADGTGEGRQLKGNLEKNRLDKNKDNSYISDTSEVNYESSNSLEFGDNVGYNEALEKGAFSSKPKLTYHHTPIGPNNYNEEVWMKHLTETWSKITEGHVIFHDGDGERAMIAALLTAGTQMKMDSKWALDRAEQRGYDLRSNTDVVSLLKTILDSDPSAASRSIASILLAAVCLMCIIF